MCNHGENNPDQLSLFDRYKRYYKKGSSDGGGGEAQKGMFINGFGNPILTIIKQETPNELSLGKWGFVPDHIKTESKAKEFVLKYTTLNAKSETVFQLPTYKSSIWNRRCLISFTAFYEWMHVHRQGKIEKIPFRISLKDEDIFSFGGIYSTWKDAISGKETTTFAIITVVANNLMKRVHNSKQRQPLIFTKETEDQWLNPDLDEQDIKNLMVPLDEKLMKVYSVAQIKFRDKNFDPNDPSIKMPYDYNEPNLFDL